MDEYVRPEPERAALLTVDTQNDFALPGAPAEISGTMDAVPRMARLVEAFRAAGAPVVHLVRLYRADGSNVDRCRRGAVEGGEEIVRPDTDGAELVDELKPSSGASLDADRLLDGDPQPVGPGEWVLYKPRWGGFYRTDLDDLLAEHAVSTVVVCGCNVPNCPRTTIYEASERDYRVALVADATSGTYERGLEDLEDIGVTVMDAGETVDWVA